MAWAGGTFTRANGANEWVTDFANGVGIEPARHDTQDNDLATGINNCLTKDGQNTPNANLPMGAFKHTNVANGSARTDYAAVGQVQDGDFVWLGTTGGTATAQTATASPSIGAYKAGQKFRFLPVAASSGQSATQHTLNINGLGAKDITNSDATNLTAGSFVSGAIVEVVYDGTRFKIVNDPCGWQDWTPTLSAPSGSVSGVSVTFAHYIKRKQIVTITGYVTFTGTSVGGNLEITNPPVASSITSAGYVITPCFVSYAAVNSFGYIYNNTGTNFGFTKDVSATNFGSGSGSVRFVFTYRGV